ncbi:hypothetical protein LTR86_001232 [Recurvomyces mirabilis]|nr:hypothetical protein LTR86_001232 [Recurvomyces mirabilis]
MATMSTLTAPVNVRSPIGFPMSRLNTVTSGFTAVNGDGQKTTPYSSTGGSKPITDSEHSSRIHWDQPTASDSPAHGWRPSGGSTYPPQLDGGDPRKRKRSDSAGDASPAMLVISQEQTDGDHSPKRGVLTLDSAVDLTSPEQTMSGSHPFPPQRRMADAQYMPISSREPSPVRRSGATEAVPPPRPEIEAGLAESLQRVLHKSPEVAEPANVQHLPKNDEQPSTPPMEDDTQMRSQSYSPEQGTAEYDAKKRKRTFSNRTKTGCHTCRTRKKKCDEKKPKCFNCLKGNYACGGYGPRPPGNKTNQATKTPLALQSKSSYEPSHGPSTYFQSPLEGPRYNHWGRIPESEPQRPTPVVEHPSPYDRDGWPQPAAWQSAKPGPSYMPERLPPNDFTAMPPIHAYAPGHPPPPMPHMPSWAQESSSMALYRPPTSHGAAISSRESATTTSSQRTAALALTYGGVQHLPEKQKMLLGLPFMAYRDTELLNDREQCKAALERYNDSALASRGHSSEERARFFRAVVEPPFREAFRQRYSPDSYQGPKGSVGPNTYVETPFTCDYGYNIHVGEEVLIQPGCYMQDACEISIGARTIIGPNVKFYGTTTSVDATQRKGSQGTFVAGAIKIGEDCFIGGDVIIMPFRRIGNGAVIGAGSVVTKDVKEGTVVAGNPAKFIRRIAAGQPDVDDHHNSDIQEQNARMLKDMRDDAQRIDR